MHPGSLVDCSAHMGYCWQCHECGEEELGEEALCTCIKDVRHRPIGTGRAY